MKKNKIGILGIGAIGSVLSLKLNDSENDIYYYNRSHKTEIKIFNNDSIERREIELSYPMKNHQELDWLIICLKEYHFKEAKELLKLLIAPKTNIVVIRNGINLKESVLDYTSESNILECMIDCPTQMNQTGDYHQLRKPILTVKDSNLSQLFEALFLEDKIQLLRVSDFKTKNWEKLIESSALGGILALVGESAWIFKDEELVNLYEKMVNEGINVAKAEGAKIESTFKASLLKKLLEYPDNKESSMLIDRRKGNPIELNAKNGIIAQLGKKHGIPTATNDIISLLLRYTNQKKELNS